MKVFRNIDEIGFSDGSAVTVGTFDGIHLGHRIIIDKLKAVAEAKDLRSVVITFEPHPQIVLKNKSENIKVLSTLEEKLEIFNDLDIGNVLVINFTREFSYTHAEDFYKDYLVDKIGLKDLILGYDHMFGKDREGNFEMLKEISSKYDFTVDKVAEYKIDGEHVSSTAIRNLLNEGSIAKASKFLGRNYSIEGVVIEGNRLGKELGFPTANIAVGSANKLIPKTGVYAVKVVIEDRIYNGMMSIGINPTVSDDKLLKLEVNIFDFSENIYGKEIKIEFISYLREEKKFESIEQLIENISLDKEKTLNIIKQEIN